MNQRVSVILLIALLVSGAATYGVYRIITTKDKGTVPTAHIVQAAKTLEIGTVLSDSDLKIGPWTGALPPGVAVKKDGLIGRGVLSTIYEGEAVMETRLAQPGAGGGLASTIPSGMRAVAVRVNDVVGVAGFVGPGTKVDVIIAGNAPGGANNSGQQARTILQNIQVLSAGQNYKTDSEGKPVVVPVVNLLVTPEQAEVLSLVNNGDARLQLVLRNPLDTQETKTQGTVMASLFGAAIKPQMMGDRAERPIARMARRAPQPEIVMAPPPPPPPISIEVLNGAKQTEAKFARSAEVRQ
jgi:pilus assembly protein CpaB